MLNLLYDTIFYGLFMAAILDFRQKACSATGKLWDF